MNRDKIKHEDMRPLQPKHFSGMCGGGIPMTELPKQYDPNNCGDFPPDAPPLMGECGGVPVRRPEDVWRTKYIGLLKDHAKQLEEMEQYYSDKIEEATRKVMDESAEMLENGYEEAYQTSQLQYKKINELEAKILELEELENCGKHTKRL